MAKIKMACGHEIEDQPYKAMPDAPNLEQSVLRCTEKDCGEVQTRTRRAGPAPAQRPR